MNLSGCLKGAIIRDSTESIYEFRRKRYRYTGPCRIMTEWPQKMGPLTPKRLKINGTKTESGQKSNIGLPNPAYSLMRQPTLALKSTCRVLSHSLVHLLTSYLPLLAGDKPSFDCGSCQKVFTTKHYLLIHERTHTGEKPFVCDREGCGVAFMQKR